MRTIHNTHAHTVRSEHEQLHVTHMRDVYARHARWRVPSARERVPSAPTPTQHATSAARHEKHVAFRLLRSTISGPFAPARHSHSLSKRHFQPQPSLRACVSSLTYIYSMNEYKRENSISLYQSRAGCRLQAEQGGWLRGSGAGRAQQVHRLG